MASKPKFQIAWKDSGHDDGIRMGKIADERKFRDASFARQAIGNVARRLNTTAWRLGIFDSHGKLVE
jgi:hypothetical protein